MNERKVLDCNSPDFIPRFFASSRLHHLSTWKSELSEMVASQMTKNNRPSGCKYKASKPDEAFRTIMHIDMDCFFASVGVRDRPHLKGKPVAVAHSQGGLSLEYSTSEIASCNYEARAKGVKNGSFIGSAKELCPDLTIIPYEFEAYDECSKQLYHTLLSTADYVQAVSCDEAYIDITFIIQQKLMEITKTTTLHELDEIIQHNHTIYQQYEYIAIEIANQIREVVYNTTQCCASIGIGNNLLVARIATNKAKPNGVSSLLQYNHSILYIQTMSIKDLPSVGRHIYEKCSNTLGVHTCGDIQHYNNNHNHNNNTSNNYNYSNTIINNKKEKKEIIILQKLKKELGDKIGEMIYNYSYGIDNRVLENKNRQSIGADINWGIRFQTNNEIIKFLQLFCIEVYKRIKNFNFISKNIILNIKKKDYIGEPGKFLGCGRCIDYSKSIILDRVVTSVDYLYKYILILYNQMNILPTDVRGIGIHLKKLQSSELGSNSLFHYIPSKISDKHENSEYTRNSSYNNTSSSSSSSSSSSTTTTSCTSNDNNGSNNIQINTTDTATPSTSNSIDNNNNNTNNTETKNAIETIPQLPPQPPLSSTGQELTSCDLHKNSYHNNSSNSLIDLEEASLLCEHAEVYETILLAAVADYETANSTTSTTTEKRLLLREHQQREQEGQEEGKEELPHSTSLPAPTLPAADSTAPTTTTSTMPTSVVHSVAATGEHWAGGISIGDVDMDVFDALPEEIQEELRTALTQRSTTASSTAGSSTAVSAPTGTTTCTTTNSGSNRTTHTEGLKRKVSISSNDNKTKGINKSRRISVSNTTSSGTSSTTTTTSNSKQGLQLQQGLMASWLASK